MMLLLLLLPIFVCYAQPAPPGGFFKAYTQGPIREDKNAWLQSVCGQKFNKPTSKSMNSDNATISEAPYAVSLKIDGIDNESTLCSGVLISPRHVLTAAHCVTVSSEAKTSADQPRKLFVRNKNPRDITVILGDSCSKESFPCWENLTTTRLELQARRVILAAFKTSGKIYVYEEFMKNERSDIAIVELERNVKTNKNIFPICLTADVLQPKQIVHIFSYGSGSTQMSDTRKYSLQMIKTKIIDCDEATVAGVVDADKRIHDICTRMGVRDRKQQPCKGDSGGPVVSRLYVDGRDRLIGLVSRAVSCITRNQDYITVDRHAKINSFVNWICQKTGVCADGRRQDYLSYQNWEKDQEMFEAPVFHVIQCPDHQWVFSVLGTETLCVKIVLGSSNYFQAKSACESMGAVLAPVRTEAEQRAVAAHSLELDPKAFEKNNIVIVGGLWHPELQQFKWLFDQSEVSRDAKYWTPGNPSLQDSQGNREECLGLVWINEKSMRLNDIPCDNIQSTIACAKDPKITVSGSRTRD